MWWEPDEYPGDDRIVRRLSAREMARRLLPLLGPHRHLLALGLGCMLVAVFADLLGPLALSRLVDAGIVGGSSSAVLGYAFAFAGLFLAGAVASTLQVVFLTRMGLAIVTRLKETLFHHLLSLSMDYFDEHPPGKLLARVESDTERLEGLFSEVAASLLRTLLLVVLMLAVMFTESWQVTAGVLLLAVPVVLVTTRFFRWMRTIYQRVRALYARISGFLAEYVQGVSVLQVFGYEARAARRLEALDQDKLLAERKAALLEYGFWGALSAVEVVAVMMILWMHGAGFLGTSMSVGTLVLFLEYTRRAFRPLVQFSEQLGQIQRALASADRVFGVLETPTRTRDEPGAREDVPDDWREVAFEGVSFEYDGGAKAVDDVSFRLRRGERVALVGLSGGGKTTLTSLLLRFHDPTDGRISVDGTDIRDIRLAAWRARIGLVLQDIHLFPGTVAENLAALAEDVPRASLERAVSTVHAEDVLARLPGGLDGELHERGGNLSMGERQILCFARALVHDPDLLVLDEATSSVDPATERRLQASMERLLAGRTALVIAHRLATVVGADRILVLHQGRLVAEGSHKALYEGGGIYRDLFDLQFRGAGAAG